MWLRKEIDLGELYAGIKYTVIFQYVGDITVSKITPGCSCTKAKWNPQTKEVVITYKPTGIPPHLKALGKSSYTANKKVTIEYNNSVDILTFTSQVIE